MDPPPKSLSATSTSVLRLEGRDALGLLHRISTQALLDREPGSAAFTLFCDFRGRLLHRAAVALTSDRAVWLLRHDAPGGALLELLERSAFRDDVRPRDLGAQWIARPVPGGLGMQAGTVRERDGMLEAVQLDDSFGLAIVPTGDRRPEEDELERIRAGRPRHEHEISEEFNPFEVGLAHEVHLQKGCYTGQEALLRLVTYGGIRRRLALLEGPEPTASVPAHLTLAARAVGRLTSTAPRPGGWTGLGVVVRDAAEGAELVVTDGAPCRIAALFPPTRPLGLP